jgi:hypothetical protein
MIESCYLRRNLKREIAHHSKSDYANPKSLNYFYLYTISALQYCQASRDSTENNVWQRQGKTENPGQFMTGLFRLSGQQYNSFEV